MSMIKPIYKLAVGIILLIVIALVLVLGSRVNQNFSESFITLESASVINETVAGNNETNATLAMPSGSMNKKVSACSTVLNDSESGNFGFTQTLDYICYSDGTFSWLNTSDPVVTLNVTYTQTWETRDDLYNTSANGETSMATVSTWQPTTATILIAGTIILMLFGLFYIFGKKKGGM